MCVLSAHMMIQWSPSSNKTFVRGWVVFSMRLCSCQAVLLYCLVEMNKWCIISQVVIDDSLAFLYCFECLISLFRMKHVNSRWILDLHNMPSALTIAHNISSNTPIHNEVNLPAPYPPDHWRACLLFSIQPWLSLLYIHLEMSQPPPHQWKVAAPQSCQAVNCTVFVSLIYFV